MYSSAASNSARNEPFIGTPNWNTVSPVYTSKWNSPISSTGIVLPNMSSVGVIGLTSN